MCPKTDGILESSLYVSDVGRSVRFYEEVFGFRVINEFGELSPLVDLIQQPTNLSFDCLAKFVDVLRFVNDLYGACGDVGEVFMK